MNPFSYTRSAPEFNLRLKQTTPRWMRYAVDFRTAYPVRYQENGTVLGEYYQPRDTAPAPLAIIIHGMGDHSLIPCRFLARTLVKQGFACFVLNLVFHSSRMPQTIKQRIPALTAQEWFEGYRISVVDVLQIVDWAATRQELDKEKLAVCGISLGGFISAIGMGVDSRIRAGVLMVMGGNSTRINAGSVYRKTTKSPILTDAEYREVQSNYANYLAEVSEKGYENVEAPDRAFLIDPLTFAHSLRERPVLMVNATWDEAVPKGATLEFWEACGKPQIAWYPGTHASIWLWYPFIGRRVVGFLAETFGR